MFKKILVPLILALVAALAIGGVAYAAGQPEKAPSPAAPLAAVDGNAAQARHRGLGQITALGDGQFTVQLKSGEETVIHVEENTRYVKADGTAGSFADLQVGRWVAGRVVASAGGPLARRVVLLPAGFDPDRKNAAARGDVTSLGDNSFTLHNLRGEDLTIGVDSHTVYAGEIHSFSDLQVGMKVVVGAQKLEDGSLQAMAVAVRPNLIRHAGEITTVDPAASTFSLKSRQGESLTFQVTPETRFRSRGGQVRGLKDLRLGMGVGVAAQEAENGQLIAMVVIFVK
jgi:hypothetical protein